MKFSFQNFGPIDAGTIELGDLTLICGPNNVGKTYISYGIYGFIKHFINYVEISFSKVQSLELRKKGLITIDLANHKKSAERYISKVSTEFSESLDSFFNTPDGFFDLTNITFSFDNLSIDLNREFEKIIPFGSDAEIIFSKAPNQSVLSIVNRSSSKSSVPPGLIDHFVKRGIAEFLFYSMLPSPFAVTSERTGVSLFYKGLDINNNTLYRHLFKSSTNTKNDINRLNTISLMNQMDSRYASPIQDNINTVGDYDNLNKRKSFIREEKDIYKPVLDALQDLLGGSFTSIDKQVLYHPKKERDREKLSIPVYMASSSIKSLFLIDLYINCLAEKGGLLIIDEPELNLHPNNQRKMAVLLARLVNAGIKVLITTHSDYIIRELNNHIMLSNDFSSKKSIMKKTGKTEQDILRPDQVKAFNLKEDHSIRAAEIDKYGINMEIFDDLIADANSLADDIYYGIGE